MNVNVKPERKPFQKPKPNPIAAQATGSAETFVRYVVSRAAAQLTRGDAFTIASRRFPGDARLRTVIRATAEPPTSLANTPALAVMGTDFIESLQPISAAAQLFRASRLMLSFDTYARIAVPDLVGLDEGPPAWVEEGQPAPVGELASQATILDPYKLEFIVVVSRETLLGSNAEKLIGDALRTKIAFDMDKALFDALPASPARPAGLRSYNARLTESTSTSNDTAMMQDVAQLVGAAESIAGGESLYLIGRTKRMMSMKQMYKILPSNVILLPSAASIALPDSVLLGVVPRAVPSAIGLPEVELVESGALEMNDAPASADLMTGGRVRSLFQSDTVGIKVRLPASWGLRHPAGANWITCTWPSDFGGGAGGGIPDAPTDGTHYGRHDGAWANVTGEAPTSGEIFGRQALNWVPVPPSIDEGPADNFTYGRRNASWQQLEAIFAILNSPAFTGNPTAPTQLAGSRDARLATTQFVVDEIASGGGLPEVPATPNGAFARVRTGATASWLDFVALRVASLDNPIFGPGAATNMSVGLGDNQTGFWRAANGPIVVSISGTALAQFQVGVTAFFEPVNMGNFTIQALGDPVNATDALNLRTGDARYLRTGAPLIGPNGANTAVGLGVGEATTGFWRTANDLIVSLQGFAVAIFSGDGRSAAINGPLSMSVNVISDLADAAADTDALNRRSGDARYLQLTGGTLTGQLIAPTGGNFNNVSLGFGDVLTGIYRAGATLGFSVAGSAQVQMMGPLVAFFQPVNMGTFTIQSLGDPAQPTDALNLRTGDARYLRSGGGPIIAPPGTAPTDVGLGVGDASTGLYRAGTSLAIAALGDVHMLFNANRTAQFQYPLAMSGNVISNLADATAADHALNRGAADVRYMQVAERRAPAVVYDLPADVNVPASGAWTQLASIPFTVPRGGNTRIMVSVSCNLADIAGGQIAMADVRIPGQPQRRVWIYSTAGATSGFTVDLTAIVVGIATINIPIEVASIGAGGAAQPLVIVAGGGLASQIVVMDLGPA